MEQVMRDRNEITDLVYRLGVVLDEGRFDEMGSLLVEDATVRTPGGTAAGREALVAQARRNHSADQQIQHVTTNVLVDFDPVDVDRANVRANLVVSFAPVSGWVDGQPAPPVGFSLGEVYRFVVVRRADGWRFARVEQDAIWMSGTRPPVPAGPHEATIANPVAANR